MKNHGLLLSFLFAILFIFPLPLSAQIQTGIEGYVYLDSEETPAQGIWVDVHAATDYGTWITSKKTDASGYYAIELSPCTSCYKVHYNTQGTIHSIYATVWNENKMVHESADTVSVQAGKLTDLNDVILTKGKTISGRVQDENTSSIEGVIVHVYDENFNWIKSTITNSSGNYSVTGFIPGNYKVFFSTLNIPDNFISIWYNGVLSREDAEIIEIVAANVTNINATLSPGGTISGTVTKTVANQDTPVPVGGAWIGVYDSNNFLRGYVISTDGSYTITGLPDIDLYVNFFEQNYRNEGIGRTLWYDQVKSFSKAQWVTVGSTGIDAHFEPSKAAKLLPVYQQLLLNP